ncbi:MAG: hypothetical protein SGCHY_000625 [Lobulomycetales sp.]
MQALGQRGVKAIDFCKQFNDRTKQWAPTVPIPAKVTVFSDRTFSFTVHSPPASWLLKKAAGIEKGSSRPGEETAGTVSVKHIYEIARIKHADSEGAELSQVARRIIGQTRSMGIKVVY